MNKAKSTSLTPSAAAEEAKFARRVLATEARAIDGIEIGPSFHQAVAIILESSGSVVVSGLGKNGPIGQKLCATFASTGTPSHFLHPTEAMHGDLGRIQRGDVVLLLSRSGNTDETVALAAILKQDQMQVISIVANRDCKLQRLATVSLCIGEVTEACPMNLAPTASTTAMLALGDAVALAVSRRRHFGLADFQKVHPGGTLGRQLMPVTEAMRFRANENLVLIPTGLTVKEAYDGAAATTSSLRQSGALLIVDAGGALAGIFTDADLRKLFLCEGPTAWHRPIDEVMVKQPHHLKHSALVQDAVQMVREFRIDEVPVIDDNGAPVGLLDAQDLIALKVISDQ